MYIIALHSYRSKVIVQEKIGLVSVFSFKKDPLKDREGYESETGLPCAVGFCKSIRYGHHLLFPLEHSAIHVLDLTSNTTTRVLTVPLSQRHRLGTMMCLECVEIAERALIFAGFDTGEVHAWSFETGEHLTHAVFNDRLLSISIDGRTMRGVCGGAGNVMEVFTVDKNARMMLQCQITLTNDGCELVKIRPDQKVFVCGGTDGRLRIYSWKTLRLLVVLDEHHGRISDVQFTANVVNNWSSKIMAVSGADCNISLWNLYN